MKKTLILIGILSSYSVFALEGSINTGIKLSPEFSPLVEDKANGIDGKAFRYEKSAYDAKLLDLNLKFKEIETTLFIFSFVLLIRLIVIFKKLNLPK